MDIEKLKTLALAEFIEWARTDEGNCSQVDLRKSLTGEDTFASALVERDWIVWQAAQRGLIAEVERLRAEVKEWLCIDCNTVYPGPPQPGVACVMCPKCKGSAGPRLAVENRLLRAKLARDQSGTKTSETRMDAAFEGGPSGSDGSTANSNSAEFDGIRGAAPAAGTVEDVDLPPLPRPLPLGWSGGGMNKLADGYSASQMKKYALAAIEAHNARSPSCGS
jgi:hypothetical protein